MHRDLFAIDRMDWHDDVTVESTPLSTTGGQTWKAAYRLAEYMANVAEDLGLQRPGVTLLELGSGTGWLGITLARNMPQASLVCLTEQLDGIEWLRHNVELNRSRGIPLDNVAVQEADWRRLAADASGSPAAEGSANGAAPAAGEAQLETMAEGASAGGDVQQRQQHGAGHADGPQRSAPGPRDLRATRWDFIVGSDLVYNEVGSRCLPRVLAALAASGTRVLYCHTKHRLDLVDLELFQQLQVCGLHAEEVGRERVRGLFFVDLLRQAWPGFVVQRGLAGHATPCTRRAGRVARLLAGHACNWPPPALSPAPDRCGSLGRRRPQTLPRCSSRRQTCSLSSASRCTASAGLRRTRAAAGSRDGRHEDAQRRPGCISRPSCVSCLWIYFVCPWQSCVRPGSGHLARLGHAELRTVPAGAERGRGAPSTHEASISVGTRRPGGAGSPGPAQSPRNALGWLLCPLGVRARCRAISHLAPGSLAASALISGISFVCR